MSAPSNSKAGLDMLSAMGKNRAERRRLAKLNGGVKIVGSMKPFIAPRKS